MKLITIMSALSLLALLICLNITVPAQDDQLNQSLAKRLVASASVKPGDVVVISGGKHMIPLMEAIAIETQMVGGQANMWLSTDKVSRSYNFDVPDKYLEIEPREFMQVYKHINVLIGLPTDENAKFVSEGMPEARLAKIAKAGDFFTGMINSLPIRVISIDFPTKEDAAIVGVDFPTYRKMTMDAVNADYEAISARANKLRHLFQNAKQIHVTSPSGTDFGFTMAAGRPFLVDDGIVTADEASSKLFLDRVASLPGGQISFAPLESSVNGKVVVPKSRCRFETIINASFEMQKGVIGNFKADKNGSCYVDMMKPYTGAKDVFGGITIGLNPALRPIEDGTANYRPNQAEGMVRIQFGDNRLIGGNNSATGGYGFAITKATVTVDGKTIVKDGRLVF